MNKHCKGCVNHWDVSFALEKIKVPKQDYCTVHNRPVKEAIGMCKLNNSKELGNGK